MAKTAQAPKKAATAKPKKADKCKEADAKKNKVTDKKKALKALAAHLDCSYELPPSPLKAKELNTQTELTLSAQGEVQHD